MAPYNQLSGRMDIYFRPHLKTKKENRERLKKIKIKKSQSLSTLVARVDSI